MVLRLVESGTNLTPAPGEQLRELLDQKPVWRQSELQEEVKSPSLELFYQSLDRLHLNGEIDRFPIGDHLMIKATVDLEISPTENTT